MILKVEDIKNENVHCWRFVSGVGDLRKTSGFDKDPDGNSVHWMRLEILKGNGKEVYDTFIINSEKAFLMNDEGKTIERLN